jgi:hypothetical protein
MTTTETTDLACHRCGSRGAQLDIRQIDLRRVIGWSHNGAECAHCRSLLRREWRDCVCDGTVVEITRRSPRFERVQ